MNLTKKQNTVHLPGLNGLRAIAALAVLISHVTLSLGKFNVYPYIIGRQANGTPEGLDLGGYGVSIFFSLSGFLITYLLLIEKEKEPVNIRYFYARRILRIWPLYYLYLLSCIITFYVFGMDFSKINLLFYVFLLANIPFIRSEGLPLVGHYWSIGVEEQFYIFWPWVVKKTKSGLLKYTLISILIILIIKVLFRLIEMRYSISWPYTSIAVTRFHCMLIGAAGAMLYFKKNNFFLSVMNNIFTQTFSWIIIIIVTSNKFHTASIIDNELVAFVGLCIIIGQITKKNRLINLDNKVGDFLGKISYGIYIIHPLVIFYFSKFLTFKDTFYWGNYVIIYSSITGATILLAYFSYEIFEKKFLRLKSNYSIIKSSATKNADN